MTITSKEVVRILDEMSSLGLKLSDAWEADGNRDGDLFSTMPFPCSLDEWHFEVEQLAREYEGLPEDHNDDLNTPLNERPVPPSPTIFQAHVNR